MTALIYIHVCLTNPKFLYPKPASHIRALTVWMVVLLSGSTLVSINKVTLYSRPG